MSFLARQFELRASQRVSLNCVFLILTIEIGVIKDPYPVTWCLAASFGGVAEPGYTWGDPMSLSPRTSLFCVVNTWTAKYRHHPEPLRGDLLHLFFYT